MLSRSLWAAIVVVLIATGIAQAAPSTGVQGCLRDSRNRYAGPGDAADAQYSDSAGACSAGVQVTISGTGGGTPTGASGPSSRSGAPTGSGAAPAAGSPGTSSAPPAVPVRPAGTETGRAPSPGAAPAPSAAATVRAALVGADSSGAAAAPGAWSHAPTWLLIIGGGVLLAIGGAAAVRVLRPGR